MNKFSTYLVVAAMEEELASFYSGRNYTKLEENGIVFYKLVDRGHDIYAFVGGIGKVSMSYRLGLFLSKHQVDLIINTGVAGSISSDIVPLSTLVATKTAFHDVDLTAFGHPFGEMSAMPLYFECDEDCVKEALKFDKENIHSGLILSGDSFVTKENFPKGIYENFDDPKGIDMESAAVGEVSHISKIPYMIIRTISDSADHSDNSTTYNSLLSQAAKRSIDLTWDIIRAN